MITWISSACQGERRDIITTHGRLKKSKVLPSASDFRECMALVEGPEASFSCLCDKRSVKMKASMKRRWKDTDRGNRITRRDIYASATLFTTCKDFSILCCSVLDIALLCLKVTNLCSFVLLKIVVLRRTVVWNIGGTILAGGKNRSSPGGILALPLFPPQIWPEIEELATNRLSHVMAFDFAPLVLTICKDSIGTAQRTHPPSTRKTETAFLGFEYEECSPVNNGDIAAFHHRASTFKVLIVAQCVCITNL